jgi:hypothetical protein
MAFDEYTKREWKVLPGGDPGAKHTEGDIVSFDGETSLVNVRCKRYGDGQYKEPTGSTKGTIEVEGYVISMFLGPNKKLRITCTPKDSTKGSNPIGGSWTAEDTSGGNDGG